MTDIVPASSKKLDNGNDTGPWYEGIHGERIAVRLSSLDTNGAYAISNARIASFLPYAQTCRSSTSSSRMEVTVPSAWRSPTAFRS
jgi:hypothetical protein